MNRLEIKRRWAHVKNIVKEAYPFLTNNDLKYSYGQEDELLNRLELKTGKEKEELISWLTGLSRISY